jgi:hypothetical protein
VGKLKFELDDLGVSARVGLNGTGAAVIYRAEHIRSERTGIHANVSIAFNDVTLAYDTFNVSRNEERTRLVKSAYPALGVKYTETYPQQFMKQDIDLFCHDLWDCWQERDPAEEIVIDLEDEIQPPEWLLEPLVLKDQPNIIFGQRSAAKSLGALIIHATIQLQWADNPFKLKPPQHWAESLYLDFERNSAMARYNLGRLQRGMELPSLSIHYKRLSGPLARNVEWVRHYLREHTTIKMVIIDSLTAACGGNLNDTGPASDFFDAERTLHTTSMILAHTSKDTLSPVKTVAGSFAFESYAGNVWECVKSQGEESNVADMCFYHRKPPAVYRTRKPIGYRVTFDEGNHKIFAGNINPENVSEFMERMTLNMRIADLLKQGALTSEDIAKSLDVSLPSLKVTISRMKEAHLIVEVRKDGRQIVWGLPAR